TLYRFAILRQLQGHHDEAYSLYKRALMTQIQTLSAVHPETIATREHLITLLRDMGRTEEATALQRSS
ncbi:MAG TPA: tetratricopeptide repeat protein, partial [Ktedonobacteraceae bacterium]